MNWTKIEGYEGYLVSDTGIVKGIDRFIELPDGRKRFAKGRIITARLSNRGYLQVRLSKNGETKTYALHRLVAQAYIPNPHGLPQINHKDGNKLNNEVYNLEWSNASLNALHAYQTGLNSNCGCNHNFAVAVIDTITGELYCTEKAFCDKYGINYNSGRNALNGQQPFPKSVDLSGHRFEKYSR